MEDMFITENVSAEGTDKKIIFVVHRLKQKYILGLVHKENLQDLNQRAADSVKVGKLTSLLGTTLRTVRHDSYELELPPSSLNLSMFRTILLLLTSIDIAKYIGKAINTKGYHSLITSLGCIRGDRSC